MRRPVSAQLLVLAIALAAAAEAEAVPSQVEPHDSGWSFSIDNDLFVPKHSDRDYTGGFSLTLAGRRVRDEWWSTDGPRAATDHLLGLDSLYANRKRSRHSMEVGVTLFTPGNTTDTAAQVGDRPYASLLYLANTAISVLPDREIAYISTFTFGVLGAPIVGNGQKAFHKAIGNEQPVGWEHQISNGGEPTLRYAFSRVERVWDGSFVGSEGEATSTWYGSVGYLTEASYSVATRIGQFRSPWWSYNPQVSEYAEKSVPVVAPMGDSRERYFWGGVTLRARAYNAFLQGQFRHSDVTFSASELRPLLVEAWLGYTWAGETGWRLSYMLRALSPEVREGPANRTQLWGGIILGYAR